MGTSYSKDVPGYSAAFTLSIVLPRSLQPVQVQTLPTIHHPQLSMLQERQTLKLGTAD